MVTFPFASDTKLYLDKMQINCFFRGQGGKDLGGIGKGRMGKKGGGGGGGYQLVLGIASACITDSKQFLTLLMLPRLLSYFQTYATHQSTVWLYLC